MATILEWIAAFDALISGIVDSPWVLLSVFLLSMIDGFFPVVPSESVVIAVAAVSASGTDGPPLIILILVAAAGAFAGDQIAFSIGRLIPIERIGPLNRGKTRELVERANVHIFQRPAPLLIAGRFIPGGRVAVNISAGAMHFPRRAFVAIDAVAVMLWATYSAVLGRIAGSYFANHSLTAAGIGVVIGVLIGLVLERVLSWWDRRIDRDVES